MLVIDYKIPTSFVFSFDGLQELPPVFDFKNGDEVEKTTIP